MCVQVTVIRNMATVRTTHTCQGCYPVTPRWCLDQTVPDAERSCATYKNKLQ